MQSSNTTIFFDFDSSDHWTIEDKKTFTVVVHDTAESAVAAFYELPVSDMLDNLDVVHECSGDTAGDTLAACKLQPAWGWCIHGGDHPGEIHVWYDKTIPHQSAVTELCEILAHEQGHMTAHPLKSYAAEERRAQGYGRAAVLAKKMAADIVYGGAYYGESSADLALRIKDAADLIAQDGVPAIVAHSDSMIAMLHELRSRCGGV